MTFRERWLLVLCLGAVMGTVVVHGAEATENCPFVDPGTATRWGNGDTDTGCSADVISKDEQGYLVVMRNLEGDFTLTYGKLGMTRRSNDPVEFIIDVRGADDFQVKGIARGKVVGAVIDETVVDALKKGNKLLLGVVVNDKDMYASEFTLTGSSQALSRVE